jgi:hypothetical protein
MTTPQSGSPSLIFRDTGTLLSPCLIRPITSFLRA